MATSARVIGYALTGVTRVTGTTAITAMTARTAMAAPVTPRSLMAIGPLFVLMLD